MIRPARLTLVAVLCGALVSVALAGAGSGFSNRFSLLTDVYPPGGGPAIGHGVSQQLALELGEVATGESDPFVLNTGQAPLTDVALHLGLGMPPCPEVETQSVGNVATIDFFLSGPELALMLQYGASVELVARHVLQPEATHVALNGHAIAQLPLAPSCEPVAYAYPVTDLLVSGSNELVIESLDGQDLVADTVRLEASPADQGDYTVTALAALDAATLTVMRDGQPFDGVRVQLVSSGQAVRSAQPSGGEVVFSSLPDGPYAYRVREVHEGGDVLTDGDFTIDSTNQPPGIASAVADPGSVGNDGLAEVTITVAASDPDGAVTAVTADLRQIAGPAALPLNDDGNGAYSATYTVPGDASPATYALPVRAVDDRGASAASEVVLAIVPAGGWDPQTVQACGFTIQASGVAQSGAGTYTLSGNVAMTHESGLPLTLVGTGGIEVETSAPQSIAASGAWTMRADLGDLGVYDLLAGEFSIDANGNLTPGAAAEYLLGEIAGFTRDGDASVDLALLLGETPGIRVVGDLVFDAVDGVPGNGAPVATVAASLYVDGTTSASIASGSGVLSWNLAAGTLAATEIDLAPQQLTVQDASFEFLPGTFDLDSRTAVTVPSLVVGPDGIQADGVEIDDFDFHYGGFQFQVQEARFANERFEARQAVAVFPLPDESVSVGVEDIVIADGEVSIAGGQLRIPPLKIGSWNLAGVEGEFASDAGQLYIACAGELAIPGFASVFIGFRLNSECEYLLQEFCMEAGFSGRGIPIGNTGFLLTDIGGCIADENCTNQWLISFTASVASVDYVEPPGVSLIGADAAMEIQPDPFMVGASGDVLLVGNLLGGGGFRFYEDRFEGYGNLEIPPGLPYLVAQTGMEVRWQPEFYFLGTANGVFQIPVGELPDIVRGLFGGENIQLAGFEASIDQQAVQGAFYLPDPDDAVVEVTARYEWREEEFSFAVDTDWGWPWLHLDSATMRRHGIRRLQRWESKTPGAAFARPAVFHGLPGQSPSLLQRPLAAVFTDSVETYPVPAEAPPLVVLLNELPAGAGTSLGLTLTTPSAVTVDSAYCAANEGFTHLRGPDAVSYRVDAPEPGDWTFTVSDIQPGEEYQLDAFFRNRAPELTWVAPTADLDQTTTEAVSLEWTPGDLDGDATTVTFYAVAADSAGLRDGQDDGPWLIASDLPDTVTTFAWAPRTFASGSYRVIAEIRDQFGKAARDTADAVITLTNEDAPLAPADLRLLPGPQRLRVIWNSVNRPDLRGYRVFYREEGAAAPDTFDVGLRNQHLLSSLANDVPHEVWVEGYDVMGQAGPASEVTLATPTDLGDVEPPAVPAALEIASFDPAANQATVTWTEVSDAVAYRVHYDTDAIGPYRATGAAEGDSPVLQGRTGQLTLTGLTPGRRYFVAISALDATGNESELGAPVSLLVSTFVDSDQDGLPDDWEVAHLGDLESGPDDDPDGDQVDNLAELEITGTDPGNPDTDGDRIPDGADPDPLSARDADADGMADDWETVYGVDDPDADPDADGLTNVREYVKRGSPWDADTDLDGLGDGYEADVSGTAVWKPDTDGGGLNDGEEVALGLDPLDPTDDQNAVGVGDGDVPAVTRLATPLPNPFNARLVVPFDLARPGRVTVEIYDLRGRRVRELVDEHRLAGRYRESWDGRDGRGASVASGVYFVRFHGDGVEQTRKVTLIK